MVGDVYSPNRSMGMGGEGCLDTLNCDVRWWVDILWSLFCMSGIATDVNLAGRR